MAPDSLDTRVRSLEGQVARLEQSRDDQRDRIAERFQRFDNDVRAFAPMLEDVIALKRDFGHALDDIAELKRELVGCRQEVADFRSELEKKQKEERAARWVRIGTLVAILGTFASSTTAVLALLVG